VQYIDSEGYIYVQSVGGWDIQQLIGQRMVIWSASGPIRGVIARKAIHLLTDEERKQVPKLKDLWIDIGARDKVEVESLVRVGDPVTLELGYQPMRNNMANSPGMDDKCGLWVVMEALRRAAAAGVKVGVYAVSTVQEEVGLRGAITSTYNIKPHAGIAVDVTHATDCPTIDKKQEGDIGLGRGPVVYRGPNFNPKVVDRLLTAASANQIPVQHAAVGRPTGTDANPMQLSAGGVATGLVSLPNRYMHSAVEMVSLTDIDHAADLLAAFVVGMDGSEDFTP
jgi:putative aminopeptidase FrvX